MRGLRRFAGAVLLMVWCVWAPGAASAQGTDATQMQGMDMSSGKTGDKASDKKDEPGMSMQMHPETFIQEIEHHSSSGTSAEPNSTPTPTLTGMKAQWEFMFHANVFVGDLQQSGARGSDRFFSTNWFMGMAQHQAGPGLFTAWSAGCAETGLWCTPGGSNGVCAVSALFRE